MTRRLTLYPKLLLGAVGVAFVFVILAGDGSSTTSGRVGGDYPAFYTAGTLVLEGRTDDLYDPVAQAGVQADLLGDEDGYLAFAYAPVVGALYAPLAALPYRTSYVVHTLLMVAALVGGLQLIRPLIGVIDRWFALVLAAIVTSYPMFMALGGGQNTALTFLLLAAIWRALADDREGSAGVAAALLLFRPQYAVPVIGLFILGRHRGAVVSAVGGAITIYLANALLLGWGWMTTWLDRVGPFLETDAEVNAGNSVSFVGFLQALLGVDSVIATVLGGLSTLAVIALLAIIWHTGELDLDARMGITAIGIVLLSPHAMFYDAGLIALPVLVLIDRGLADWRLGTTVWGLGFLHLLKGTFDATPFALVVMSLFVLSVMRFSEQAHTEDDRLTVAIS